VTVRSAAKVTSALVAKGMTPTNNHHKMFRMEVDGVLAVVTRVSHGRGGEINESLGNLMARQCQLELKQFWELIDCPLSADQWQDLIRQKL